MAGSRRPREGRSPSTGAPGYQGRLTDKRFWSRIQSLARVAEVKGAKFPKDTPEKRVRRMARAVVRPESFNTTYLPHYFGLAVAAFHKEIYRLFETANEGVIEVPRGHGKSTSGTFAYSLRQVACAPILEDWCNGTLDARWPEMAQAIQEELDAWRVRRELLALGIDRSLREFAPARGPPSLW